MIDVNLNGLFYVAQVAAQRIEQGVIANMASTNGLLGYPYYADYNASKAGVIELTRSMALELGNPRLVNTILLGVMSNYLPFEKEQWIDAIKARA